MRFSEFNIQKSDALMEFKKVMHQGDNYFIMLGSTDFNSGKKYWIKGPNFDQTDSPSTIKYLTIRDAIAAAEQKNS